MKNPAPENVEPLRSLAVLNVIIAIVVGAVVFVVALVVGTVVGYRVFRKCGVTEMEGMCGFYAFFFAGLPVGIVAAVAVGRLIV